MGTVIDADGRDDLKSTLAEVFAGTSEQTFIREADRANLEDAFPGIAGVLQTYEA